MAFLGFQGGAESVHIIASMLALRRRFGLKIAGNQALGLTEVCAKPRPQIWRGPRAVLQTLVTHGAVRWASPSGAVSLRLRASPGPLGAQIAALQRTKSTVETLSLIHI